MMPKAGYGYLKGLLFGVITFITITGEAQTIQKQLKEKVLQTPPSGDSVKADTTVTDLSNKTNYSDTSLSSLLMKLEKQVILLNKDIATLRRGFDTSDISEELPLLEKGLDRMQANLGKLQVEANIRNLNSIKVALQQALKKIKIYQEKLNIYSDLLAAIGENQARFTTDSLLKKMPGDSILKDKYLIKLNPVIQKWKTNDSLLSTAINSIGLLQSGISGSYLRCTELLDDVDVKIKNSQANLFRRDAPFLWQAKSTKETNTLQENIQLGLKRNLKISLFYLSLSSGSILLALFLGIIFFIMNKLSIKKIRNTGMLNWDMPLHFLKNKIWLPTLLIIFTLLPFSLKNPPAGLVEFLWLLMLLTATLIRWKDWPLHFRHMWIGIILFFIFYSMDSLLLEATFSERILLVVLHLFAMVLGLFMYREVLKNKSSYHKLMDDSILLFAIFNLLALALNIFGRVNLARVLANTAVLSISLMLALQIIREILMEFLYIQIEAYKHLNRTGFTEFNKMKERFRTTLGVITIILWILALTWSMNLFDIIQDNVVSFLAKKRSLGEINFTFSGTLVFVAIIWLAMLAGKLVSFLFQGDDVNVASSRKSKSGSLILFSKLAIYTIGIILAFAATGIGSDKMAIIVGALGVGIGFGLQNIVNNLVSGVILAIEKPMEIGDVIELGTRLGTVKEIGFRSSKISTFEGSVIIVPNGEFISQQLINWTHSNNNYRRVEIIVGVKYGSNLEQVKTIIDTIIKDNADIAKYPAPNILVNEFANSAVNMRILFWTSDYDKWVLLKSKIHQEIYESFAENGIEIPYAQTDLHIRSVDPEAAETLRGKPNQ